ncbi:hypothetical protein HPB48_001506 [Haemaphysalis longicornis]|uniref:Uncharacterized protein n=1 Tax=Haemaphysalis longicornis TaxID=44386 RepID=A0A9J6H137_HAELO|nr:hypothetical protein HPB48_001506 [Haemaphysalis longicornis]
MGTLQDAFVLRPEIPMNERLATKSLTLKAITKIFDPIELFNPVVITAKILLQDLGKRRLEWDDEVPDDFAHSWRRWCEKVDALEWIHIPRFFGQGLNQGITKATLHVFTDVSRRAMVSLHTSSCKIQDKRIRHVCLWQNVGRPL